MKREFEGSLLSTVFVDYDNIYLSLKRKSEEAAKRFAKDAGSWLTAIASGQLITPTNGAEPGLPRRIVMNRCYGNSVPRRNAQDNATDMNSFPFVRHHFVRAGFEVIDCPPLTAQLKNSADIRMVMDVRDYLLHDTYFDEFVILSGDADFTPVLHRLRQHARRTVVYANDYTVAPYRAISDGEVREADLIKLLLEGSEAPRIEKNEPRGLPSPASMAAARSEIINEVLTTVRQAQQPVPLEALADKAVRVLGHDKTVGLAWGGAGSFRDLLLNGLPSEVRMSEAAPYFVYDTTRQAAPQPLRAETREPDRSLPSADDVRAAAADARPAAAQPRIEDPAAWSRGVAAEPGIVAQQPAPQPHRADPAAVATSAPAASQPEWNRKPLDTFTQRAPAAPAPQRPQAAGAQPASHPAAEASYPAHAPVRPPVATEAAPAPAFDPFGAVPARQHPQPSPLAANWPDEAETARIEPRLPEPMAAPAAPRQTAQPGAVPQAYAAAAPAGQPAAREGLAPRPQAAAPAQAPQQAPQRAQHVPAPAPAQPSAPPAAQAPQPAPRAAPQAAPLAPQDQAPVAAAKQALPASLAQRSQAPERGETSSGSLQAAIARIHEACQAPPLSPPEYRVLFQVMAEEITANGLTGSATLLNIAQRAQDHGVEVRRDDVRFVLEVVSEADPWFEQGASAPLFAGRFRNFVVARCRSQGLQLSADELDLIEAWFSAGPAVARAPSAAQPQQQAAPVQQQPAPAAPAYPAQQTQAGGEPGWYGTGATGTRSGGAPTQPDDDFPRILQRRARG